MFVAKAHNREKYGDSVVVHNDRASELLNAVPALPAGSNVVEGEAILDGREDVERVLREQESTGHKYNTVGSIN